MYTTKRVWSKGTRAFKKGLPKSEERRKKKETRKKFKIFKKQKKGRGHLSKNGHDLKSEAAETEDDELIYIRLELFDF
jgi:hypothetical protein